MPIAKIHTDWKYVSLSTCLGMLLSKLAMGKTSKSHVAIERTNKQKKQTHITLHRKTMKEHRRFAEEKGTVTWKKKTRRQIWNRQRRWRWRRALPKRFFSTSLWCFFFSFLFFSTLRLNVEIRALFIPFRSQAQEIKPFKSGKKY